MPPILLLLAAAVFFAGRSKPISFDIFSKPPTLVAYIYESNETRPAPHVAEALRKVRERGIDTASTDDDVQDGDGNTPEFVKPAIKAARKHGLPALVILANEQVLSVSDVPATVEGILEAVP